MAITMQYLSLSIIIYPYLSLSSAVPLPDMIFVKIMSDHRRVLQLSMINYPYHHQYHIRVLRWALCWRSPCSSYHYLFLSILIIRVLQWALCWRSPPSSWLVEPCPQTIKSFSSAKTGHCWSSWYGRCLLKGGSNRFLKIKIQYLLCGGEHSL